MNDLNEIFNVLVAVVSIVSVVYIIARYNYLIKKTMIENGVYLERKNNRLKYLEIACIAFGVGIGLFVSSIFNVFSISAEVLDLYIWGTTLIFGAAGVLLAHLIRNRLDQ